MISCKPMNRLMGPLSLPDTRGDLELCLMQQWQGSPSLVLHAPSLDLSLPDSLKLLLFANASVVISVTGQSSTDFLGIFARVQTSGSDSL